MSATRRRHLVEIFLLAALYLGVARLGLEMDAVAGFATLVWPCTGIALAALLLFGFRLWPGIALGAFVANLWTGAPAGVALGMAVGNTLEAVVGVLLLRRAGFRNSLSRVRDVLSLVALAALLSTLVSATIGVVSLLAGGIISPDRLLPTARAWWLGDVMGDLVVAPLILSVATATRTVPSRRRVIEATVLLASLLGFTLFIFSAWGGTGLVEARQTYLVFPPLVWAALRFGIRGSAVGTFVVSAIAVAGTAMQAGPFAGASLSEGLFSLQAFMAVVAITILVLGAVIAERDEAVRKREELLEIVSHELRNPLNTVRMSAELLLRGLPADEPATHIRKPAAMVQRSVDRMAALIQDLLDLSAIESGRLAVDAREVEACEIVEEAIEMLRPVAAEKSQAIEVSQPEGKHTIVCDRERVIQVVVNLVGNAIKFSREGSSITVEMTPEEGQVKFSIRDTGPGIPPEQLPRLFTRHWQAHPNALKGSGLGLFICKGIVDAHGGKIWVESRVGSGSTFHFTIPRAPRKVIGAG